MDVKHTLAKMDVAENVTTTAPLVSPATLEYMLLSGNHQRRYDEKKDGGVGPSMGGEEDAEQLARLDKIDVGYLFKWSGAIAMCDLQGQTAPEPDWYDPNSEFVCTHCLQICRGLPIGNPIVARKLPDSGLTIWTVRDRFGSVGCALRYASDNRYTFANETSGLLPTMLMRAYGFQGDVTEIPIAPCRTALPPFQPELASKWAKGEIEFDGLSFHKKLNTKVAITPPDKSKHLIVSDHAVLLVDALVPRDKLGFKAGELKRMFPNLFIKPRPIPSQHPTPNPSHQ